MSSLVSIMMAFSVAGGIALDPMCSSVAEARKLRPLKDLETEQKVLAMYNDAVLAVREKKYIHARILLERAATYDPTSVSPFIHSALADVYHNLGNPEQAVSSARKALSLDPEQKELYYMLGIFLKDLHRYDEAIECLQKYVAVARGERKENAEAIILSFQKEREKLGQFSPRSLDYLDHLYAEQSAHQWPRERLPLKVFIEMTSSARGFCPSFAEIARDAFASWVRASGHRLAFAFVDSAEQADITVEWTNEALKTGDERKEHAKAGLTTTARGKDDLIKHARIQLRTVLPDGKTIASEDIMKETCLHEIGHAIGLNGHSTNPADIMYFGNSSRKLPALSKRDKATISRLYSNFPRFPVQGMENGNSYPGSTGHSFPGGAANYYLSAPQQRNPSSYHSPGVEIPIAGPPQTQSNYGMPGPNPAPQWQQPQQSGQYRNPQIQELESMLEMLEPSKLK